MLKKTRGNFFLNKKDENKIWEFEIVFITVSVDFKKRKNTRVNKKYFFKDFLKRKKKIYIFMVMF